MRFRMLDYKLLFLIAVSFCLAESNVYAAAGPFTIGLTGVGAYPVANPYVTVVSPFTGPATALQTVVKIDFNPATGTTYTQAKIDVYYNPQPSGWTVNIADSLTCDGYGGDAGTTKNNAELQIVGKIMDIYSTDLGPGVVDHLLNLTPVLNKLITFVVKNQSVSWSPCPASGILDTSNSHLLYAIPDTDPGGDGSKIYLGLNRVVHGPGNRIGQGAIRAVITLQ